MVNISQDPEDTKALGAASKFVRLVDNLLAHPVWERSLFLRNIKKRLTALRSDAQTMLDAAGESQNAISSKTRQSLPPGFVEIYIMLYQADGRNLPGWRNTLNTLADYSISKSIYLNEDHVREFIRSRYDPQKYGYAAVRVSKEKIIQPIPPKLDPLEHELITLRENSVNLTNLTKFIHGNIKEYILRNGELVLINAPAESSSAL